MKQAMKRTGSLLLAICMLITMLPVRLYAETGKPDNIIQTMIGMS